MGEGRFLACGAELVHSGVQMAVSAAEADNQQFGIVLVAFHFYIGHFYFGNFLGTQAGHQVVVLRVGRDGACLVVFLQSAEDVGEAFCSGDGPVAAAGLFIALVGCP